ncbi:MAG: RNA polymerase factor sigma-54 [Candidatus Anammoxibacter sp.]
MKLEASLQMQQTMKLAPQIIQSIEILQLPTMALIEHIQQELEENPVLEEVMAPESDKVAQEDGDELSNQDNVKNDDVELERQSQIDEEWRDYFSDTYSSSSRKKSSDGEFDKKQQAIENTAAKPMSLHDYLLEQLSLLTLPEDCEEICEYIIYNIDKMGYLENPLEKIAESFENKTNQNNAKEALDIIQTMEPLGVGARNLKECLLLQLDKKDEHYALAEKLISNHLEDIEAKRYPHIASKTRYDLKTVKEVINFICTLNPKPGLLFDTEIVPHVIPEVRIELIDGKYEVILLNNNVPQIYINDFYSKTLTKKDAEPETYGYVQKKINSARWLIDALEQRRNTMYKVTNQIVHLQKEFLDKGVFHLKALKMQEVADAIGMHVSTVSRAISHKYAQTPQGTYELKFFFTGGFKTDNGSTESWETLRQKLADIITNEDKKKPLSDEDIMQNLKDCGVDIARRTITKYRRIMKIPSSRRRRVF